MSMSKQQVIIEDSPSEERKRCVLMVKIRMSFQDGRVNDKEAKIRRPKTLELIQVARLPAAKILTEAMDQR
jgi:hypothetical protein